MSPSNKRRRLGSPAVAKVLFLKDDRRAVTPSEATPCSAVQNPKEVPKEEKTSKPKTVTTSKSSPAKKTKSGNASRSPSPRKPDVITKLLLTDLQSNNSETVASALEKFSKLLDEGFEDLKNAKDAMELGAPSLIVLALQKWKTNPEIQIAGCCCLASLAHLSGMESAMARAGAIDIAAEALQEYPDHKDVQDVAIHAMANIAFKSTQIIHASMHHFVAEYQGFQLVHRAMTQFPLEVSLQNSCCALLDNLAQHSDFHTGLVKAGLVSRAAAALENHFGESEVKERASSFLHQVSAGFQFS